MTTTTRATAPAKPSVDPVPLLPRLLAGVQPDAPVALEEHLARYGGVPWQGPPRRGASPLIAMIEASGLRGRGGGAFPTGRKLRTVAAGRGRPVVVANGTEGEPASFKDKLLLAAVPHLVLDGAALAAEAIGADEVVVAIDRTSRASLQAVAHAIGTRQRVRFDPVPFRLVQTPSRYVAGEESALVAFVDGKPAQPTSVPPRPFERGVGGRPTLIQNVETLAHIALIARFGPAWFRELGTDDEPGTMLVTVSGAVAHPGVCEVKLGARLSDALAGAGGPTADLAAVLVGGYYGSWLPADALDVPLTNAVLRPLGAGLGCGVLYAFPAGHCGVQASARILDYLAGESAGQCGPCAFGLRAVADTMQKIADGRHDAADLQRLDRWVQEIPGRGACSYPDGVVRFAASALRVFDTEVERHGARGRCLTGEPPPMPLPDPRLASSGWL
jgi:NADH:ubiquinone oxidoreductase subunit F (NADH-binding)